MKRSTLSPLKTNKERVEGPASSETLCETREGGCKRGGGGAKCSKDPVGVVNCCWFDSVPREQKNKTNKMYTLRRQVNDVQHRLAQCERRAVRRRQGRL